MGSRVSGSRSEGDDHGCLGGARPHAVQSRADIEYRAGRAARLLGLRGRVEFRDLLRARGEPITRGVSEEEYALLVEELRKEGTLEDEIERLLGGGP
jgi:hypothetical protein